MSKIRASAVGGAALAILAISPFALAPSAVRADDSAPAAAPAADNAMTPEQAAADFHQKVAALPWQMGPGTATVGDNAKLALPKDSAFLPPPDSSTFIQLEGNPPSDGEYIFRSGDWFAVYSFNPAGYVKDTDKIDPDALLQQLKDQNAKNIEERKQLGISVLTLQGWFVPPHYDPTTHRLEWGTKLTDETGAVTLNYTVRMLGRSGYTSATLVSDPSEFDGDLAQFKTTLNGYSFNPDQTYAAYQSGDKVAEYGLGALVVGGAAAVAAKAGLPFLKFIFVGLAAAGASVVAFFRRLFGRKAAQPPKPTL